MNLKDSLDVSQSENEETYRVGYPHPHSVKNEEGFIINSARTLKKQDNHLLNKENSQPLLPDDSLGISDSLQAELHLSLDRLSENSYDQDDLNRIKLKSQPEPKHLKTYPMLITTSQTGSNFGKISSNIEHPAAGLVLDFHDEQHYSDDSATPKASSHHDGPVHPNDENADDVEDDDDIRTVVVEDSLSFDEERKPASREPNSATMEDQNRSDEQRASDRQDPYAHLRYNPEWRNVEDPSGAGMGVTFATDYHEANEFDPHEPNSFDDFDSSHPNGGAITVHNQHLLLGARDSPVRLSADPSRLLHMNEKFEAEFNRMLEQEQHWKEDADVPSPIVDDESKQHKSSQIKSHLKPPAAYTNTSQDQTKAGATDQPFSSGRHQSPQKANPTGGVGKRENKSYAPAPPKAPKSNRDYIELNKTRLGRKSNSASYLEMYSKKNRLLEQAKSPRRPLSDVRHTESKALKKPDYPRMTSDDNSSLTVEEQWKQQADRLKVAKELKSQSKVANQKTLREVGNRESTKPTISPSKMVADPSDQGHRRVSPTSHVSKSPISPRSSVKSSSKVPNVDFSTHPAFATLSNGDSYRGDGFDSTFDTSFSSERNMEQPHHPSNNPSLPLYNIDPRYRAKNNAPSLSPPLLPTNNPHFQQESHLNHGPDTHHQYHHVRKEDYQGHQTSPLMQAYHQVFAPIPSFPLPPQRHHPDHVISEQRDPDWLYGEERQTGHALQLPPDRSNQHGAYSNGNRQIPDEARIAFHPSLDPNFEPTRLQPVPRLPPIGNKQAKNNAISGDAALRQSLSDSEATPGGSYLRQHEKKKMKPSYRRYTIEDYKSLKRDINLGGLGPDLMTAKMKAEKIDRVKKYSEFIRQQHKSNSIKALDDSASADDDSRLMDSAYVIGGAKQRFTLGETEKKKMERQERRRKALDYARQVPKPKAVVAPIRSNDSQSRDASPGDDDPRDLEEANQRLEWELLKNLRDRHEREKAIVAEMTSPRRVT